MLVGANGGKFSRRKLLWYIAAASQSFSGPLNIQVNSCMMTALITSE